MRPRRLGGLRSPSTALFDAYSGNTPGCAVAIVDEGTVAYANAYGLADLNTKRPLLASSALLTPQGPAAGSWQPLPLMLVEEHRLDLDQDIHTYIPELPAYGLEVTVRDLLDDTSGDQGLLWGAAVS